MISGFVDIYLNLSRLEEIEFEEEIRKFSQPIQEGVMQITTSCMRQGLEQGIEREKVLIIRLLKRKLGDKSIGIDLESRIMALKIDVIERLGEEILDFSTIEDLVKWLKKLKPSKYKLAFRGDRY
ncbi:MAG: DUF4351 domain-containing protein [Cylindrospermopsis raciborskii]|uniref:DUF4351 domain-containing protein n=1 Tax=Cylindrospermopsis raciborskii TaxID=77022 RepID=UPI003D0FE8A8